MKGNLKFKILKIITLFLVFLAFIFLYGFIIGEEITVYYLIGQFSFCFISLCFFVKETDRKKLAGIFKRNIIVCLILCVISTFVYEGVNKLQVKESVNYSSTVTEIHGRGGTTVRFLDRNGVEQSYDLNDYSLVYGEEFSEGDEIFVTENIGIFNAPFYSIEKKS